SVCFLDMATQVDQLSCVCADDVGTEQLSIGASEEEFEKGSGFSDGQTPSFFRVMGPSCFIMLSLFHPFFPARLLGFAYSGDLGNCVDAHGQHLRQALFILEAESVANAHAPLLHRS